jgi:hypothetical protein
MTHTKRTRDMDDMYLRGCGVENLKKNYKREGEESEEKKKKKTALATKASL